MTLDPDILQPSFNTIAENLGDAQSHLDDINAEMARVEEDGMYPAVPNEQWQTRAGTESEYLYMTFRTGPDGEYQGPDGKRKIYIGNKSPRISRARRLANNRRYWEDLDRAYRQLETWINRRKAELASLARNSQYWPKFKFAKEADPQTAHEHIESLGR